MATNSKATLTTRNGFRFEVRSARPEDEPVLAEFFTHVTQDDLRFRFLGGVKAVSHERLAAMTCSDDAGIHNFLAFSADGLLIAVATLACDQPRQHGEVAICTSRGSQAPGRQLGVARLHSEICRRAGPRYNRVDRESRKSCGYRARTRHGIHREDLS